MYNLYKIYKIKFVTFCSYIPYTRCIHTYKYIGIVLKLVYTKIFFQATCHFS